MLSACEPPPKTITVFGEDSSNTQAISQLKNDFYAEKGIKLRVLSVPFEDALTKANVDLGTGAGKYDVILQYNFTLASYVEDDFVWKLEELGSIDHIKDSLFENAWREVGFYYSKRPDSSGSGPSEAFGLPFASNTMLLVVNEELVRKNEAAFAAKFGRAPFVPSTWSDLISQTGFYNNLNGAEPPYGIVLQGKSGGWLYYEWAAICASIGAQLFDKEYGWEWTLPNTNRMESPEVFRATTIYRDLRANAVANFEQIDASAQLGIMENGEVAFAIMWSDFVPPLAEVLADDGGRQFSFHPIPGDASPLAGGSFYINKSTRNEKEAFEFVDWIFDEQRQSELIKLGLMSPSKRAYTKEVLDDVPWAKALYDSLNRGVYAFEAGRDAEIIQQTVTKYIQQATRPGADIPELLGKARQEISEGRAGIQPPYGRDARE